MGPMNIDYSTEFSYPTTESSANMVSQEYSGLDNADLFFPIESGRLDNFLVPNPEQYLPLYDTNQSFNDESQFPPQFEDFETHYHYLDVDLIPPFENNIPEDTASRAGSTKSRPFVCEMCQRGFTRPADLKRHRTVVHQPVFTDCPMNDCSRKGCNGFVRKDHLVEHVRQFHRVDIKKRKCSKRSTKTKKHLECFYLIRRLIARYLCRLRPGLS